MSLPTPPPDTGGYKEGPVDAPIYLIPLSESARSSSQLPVNDKKRLAATLRLAPTLDTSYYTLGTGNNCDIVIQTVTERECWVNYHHCQLIPDPDKAAITVSNTSRTTFTVRDVYKRDPEVKILQRQAMSISEGKWYLTLGQGLRFLVIVPPCKPNIDLGLLVRSGSSQNFFRPCDMGVKLIGCTKRAQIYVVQRRGIDVAAKVFTRNDLVSAARTWQNEKNILAYLSPFRNKHITNLVGMDGSRLTLYIDYIAGCDLSKMVTEDGFSHMTESEAYAIWLGGGNALEYLHSHGVIHNDIKPSNILLCGNRAVVCDFGIATIGSKLHYNGTPSYVSPDIMLRENRSEPDDIWALGVTMLFAFGFIPLPGHSWVIKKIEESDLKTLLAMNKWISEIRRICQELPGRFGLLQRMLIEDRAERITASELSANLSASLT